jgi:hypothetical protein
MPRSRALPTVAVVAMLVLAGCGGLGGGDASPADTRADGTVLDAVPNEAAYVVVADPVGLATDPTTETVANTLLEELGQSPEYATERDRVFDEIDANISEAFADLGVEADLTVSGVGPLATFGSQPAGATGLQAGSEYSGVVLRANLTAAEVSSLFEAASAELPAETRDRVSRTTYNGVTLYTANGTSLPDAAADQQLVQTGSVAFAVLDGEAGLHAAGTPDAVRDAIDTYRGDDPGLAPEVRPPLDDRTYLSLGLGADAIASATSMQSASVPGNATSMTASLQTGDQEVVVTYGVSFEQADTAEAAATALRENLTGSDAYDASVSVDGRTVDAEVSASATETAELLQQYAMLLAGSLDVDASRS